MKGVFRPPCYLACCARVVEPRCASFHAPVLSTVSSLTSYRLAPPLALTLLSLSLSLSSPPPHTPWDMHTYVTASVVPPRPLLPTPCSSSQHPPSPHPVTPSRHPLPSPHPRYTSPHTTHIYVPYFSRKWPPGARRLRGRSGGNTSTRRRTIRSLASPRSATPTLTSCRGRRGTRRTLEGTRSDPARYDREEKRGGECGSVYSLCGDVRSVCSMCRWGM